MVSMGQAGNFKAGSWMQIRRSIQLLLQKRSVSNQVVNLLLPLYGYWTCICNEDEFNAWILYKIPGNNLTTFIELNDDEWTISSVDKTSGESSVLKIAKHRAGNCNYDYAMLVNENVCSNCQNWNQPKIKSISCDQTWNWWVQTFH